MEKRKVFKISIIDKEISRTEFDRNTFYTSDSELSLVFKLIEKDYSYDHGEILLYNENDESFVTRRINKKENDFVYELDLDIIPHYGKWLAQLQLVKESDVYTSKPFEFNIVNDLSNLAPQPTLTDINNWATLKQSANELIDEMQTVIDDIKKAESKHGNAERVRQTQETNRVQNENSRQSQENVRNKSETTRQNQENKRVQSENERRLKELERENSERNRQSIFENNEVRRKDTFNANEATRQENEMTRQEAEQERQSAELNRVSAEAQRKIDHANRSAELDGKANKKQEDWITPTLLNGATGDIQFRKNQFGRVEFRGKMTGSQGRSVFALPTGYRPLNVFRTLAKISDTSNVARSVYITNTGLVYFDQPYGTYEVYFDTISFSAD